MGSKVHPEEVTDRQLSEDSLGTDRLGIEADGFVIVSVPCEEIPRREFRKLLARIGNALSHGLREQIVEGGEVLQSARTFECFEEMPEVDFDDILVGMMLQKLVTGCGTAHATEYPQLAEMQIRNVGAIILPSRLEI